MRTLLVVAVVSSSCGPMTRNAAHMRMLPAEAAVFEMPVGLPSTALAAKLPEVAKAMALSVEEREPSWVLYMGPRLNDGPVWYRVDLVAVNAQSTRIRIWGAPSSLLFDHTRETIGKPGELAARLVAAAGGAQ